MTEHTQQLPKLNLHGGLEKRFGRRSLDPLDRDHASVISQGAADACLEAVKIARELGDTISTDLNDRAKLWSYGGDREAIMTELTSYCDVILGMRKMQKNILEFIQTD